MSVRKGQCPQEHRAPLATSGQVEGGHNTKNVENPVSPQRYSTDKESICHTSLLQQWKGRRDPASPPLPPQVRKGSGEDQPWKDDHNRLMLCGGSAGKGSRARATAQTES